MSSTVISTTPPSQELDGKSPRSLQNVCGAPAIPHPLPLSFFLEAEASRGPLSIGSSVSMATGPAGGQHT